MLLRARPPLKTVTISFGLSPELEERMNAVIPRLIEQGYTNNLQVYVAERVLAWVLEAERATRSKAKRKYTRKSGLSESGDGGERHFAET